MHEFYSLLKLRKYIERNEHVEAFLKEKGNTELNVNSFRAFVDKYEKLKEDRKSSSKSPTDQSIMKKDNESGSKFSERIFAYWIMSELTKGITLTLHKKIEIPLRIKGTDKGSKASIPKDIDYFINGGDNAGVFIELKANIDNIEKDLYKFRLMKDTKYKKSKTVLLIWENEDHWKSRESGNLCQYATLLKHAKSREILDHYFYLSNIDKNKRHTDDITRRLKEQISELKSFLRQVI